MAKKVEDKEKETEPTKAGKAIPVNNYDKVKGVMNKLNTHYKNPNLIKTGDKIPPIYKVPFGEPILDYVSDGGIPIGRITEFLGDNHSGKTRNALKAMGKFQRYCFNCHTAESLHATWYTDPNDENAIPQLMECHCDNCNNPRTNIQVMVDAEGTTDPDFLELLGVDTQGIIYSRPAMPSQAIGIIETFLAMPDIGLILLDSIGGMGSDKEVVTAIEDEKMNQNALFFNKALRKWQMAFNANTNEFGTESGTSLIVVNQSYTTLDFFAKEVATGGRGLRHGKGLSLKSRIKEKAKLPNSNKILGVHIDYVNEKNKTGMPYRRKDYYLNLDPANTDLGYCQTDVNLQYMELALEQGLIEQRGAWFYFGDDGKWNGREKLMADFPQGAIDMVKKTLYGERR